MDKRRMIFGDYDTAADGLWTLSGWTLKKGAQVQHYVDVPGRPAPLDLSTVLTDGQPYYGNASLEVSLESSEGDRMERADRIGVMVNYMDGRSLQIYLPDDEEHYLIGRVQVQPEYNDLAHCAVTVSAVCEPWKYATKATTVQLTATSTVQTARLVNSGRLAVVPLVEITGEVTLIYDEHTWTLTGGTYTLPELYLTPGTGLFLPGVHEVSYKGSGSLTITYREAVLAA